MLISVIFGIIFIILLLAINRKLGPGVLMLLIWFSLIVLSIVINGIPQVVLSGLFYIEVCCMLYYITEQIGYRQKYHIIPRRKTEDETININRIGWTVNLAIVVGLFLCIYAFRSNNFSIWSLKLIISSMQSAYSNSTGGIFISLLISFFNGMFAIDGFITVYSKIHHERYRTRVAPLFFVVVIYSIFIAKKTPVIWCGLLWLSGALTATEKYIDFWHDIKIFIKRNRKILLRLGAIALIALFVMMALRYGSVVQAKNAISEYLLEEVYVFSIWFSQATENALQHSHGRQLLLGIFDQIGMNNNIMWNWNQNPLALQYGFTTNIYTVFWAVIQDFGFVGSYVFWIIFGFISGLIRRNLERNDSNYIFSFLLMSVHFFILMSFIASSGHTLVNIVAQFWFMIILNICRCRRRIRGLNVV